MLVHRRIVLQLGAMFLIVTLKTHGVVTRSITDSGHQQKSLLGPETASKVIPSTNRTDHHSASKLNHNLHVTPNDYNAKSTSGVNLTHVSAKVVDDTFSNVNKSMHKNYFDNDLSYFQQSSTEAGLLNSFISSDHNFSKTSEDTNSSESSFSAQFVANNITEVPFESLTILGEGQVGGPFNVSILRSTDSTDLNGSTKQNFGPDLKKLKENVDSFKDNFRKLLLEADSPSGEDLKNQINSRNTSEQQDSERSSLTDSMNLNTSSSDQDFHDILYAEGSPSDMELSPKDYNPTLKAFKRDPSHRKNFVANVTEISQKVGNFIQKQYWDTEAQSSQDELLPRGLETLVSGVEESELPSSQVLQQWVNLEENFRESVDAVVRQALPLLVRASSEMQLSNGCYTSFFQLLLGLRRLRPWAFQMIDAFGKPPAGMLQGTVTSFGAYDECVNIVAMSDSKKKSYSQQYFRGKYCTVEIKPPLPPKPQYYTMYQPVSILANFSNGDDNVIRQAARQAHAFYFLTYRMDVCVPSTCTQDDVNNMAQFAAKYIDIEVAVPRCSVKENLEWDRNQVIIICIVGVLFSFVVFGTFLDTLGEIFHKTKALGRCLNNLVAKFLLSFSLNTNSNLLLNTDDGESGLDSLHGMRFFGMGWLVLGHTYFNSNVQMYGNLSEASAFAEGFLFQIIVNSTVSIDTFFFISAVLLSYLTLQSTSKHGYYSIPRLFLRRLIRTLPPYMMVIAATLLLPHLGSGPFWNETVDPVVESCKQNWWTNILFINNFVTTPVQRCLEHSWYLSCDFQLFTIALFLLLALNRHPALGIALNIVMIMVSMVMTGLLTYYYKVPPTLLASFPDPEERKFLNHVVISKPYCHLGPYCVGLLTGYLFYKCREIKLKAYHHILGWGSSIAVTAAVVYGVLEWNKGNMPSTAAALAYAATHRTAWALGLSWITVICVAGYGSIISRILSFKVFVPLSRLTYMVYLIHPLIQYILTGYIRERLQTNHIILAYFFFGHIMTSYALSAACFFLFDGPVEALMNLLLGNCTAPAPELSKTSAVKKLSNNNIQTEKERNMSLRITS
ncbi:nose resistant to fluoxetine protein 6-like [Uloborus diversus]|uniref:nose resistant to fluoxetine protein 6-like n=1 Tax=Uloborus diversus TaxID=327109 RepID=UPI002409A52A|nr:nose resistant to fluoxetine protein 6-like [Uloborus diversus]